MIQLTTVGRHPHFNPMPSILVRNFSQFHLGLRQVKQEVNDLRLEHFYYLKKVAEFNSINAASYHLFITQQSLSRAIKSLEEELGTQLLERSKQGVALTTDGQFVLNVAEQVIEQVEGLKQHFRSRNLNSSGQLNVMANAGIARSMLSTTISYFYRYLPNIKLNISYGENDDIIQALKSGSVDAGVISFFEINKTMQIDLEESLQYQQITQWKMKAALSKQSMLSKHKAVSLKQLSKQPFIQLPGTELDNKSLMQVITPYGSSKMVPAHSEKTFVQLLSDNLGWSLLPEAFIAQFPSSVVFSPLKENLVTHITYLVRKDDARNPLTELFFDSLVNQGTVEHTILT